tara:strand:+ start:185 stop:766 length:582 start_codon:yes stop_codon:yes gene_type:complete
LWKRQNLNINTERCYLRLPNLNDFESWVNLRKKSEDFLSKWEPERDRNFYSMTLFRSRVKWAKNKFNEKKVIHAFIFRREDESLIGAVTLDNVRRGAAQSGSIGYWLGEPFQKKGYMFEAVQALVFYVFKNFDLSRLEAATLPENQASRSLLERVGFKYEGVSQSYLQISGRWRNHVMYALLRNDRRGRTTKI